MGRRDRERKERIRRGEEEPISPRKVVEASEDPSEDKESTDPTVRAFMAGVRMFPSVMRNLR